MQQGNALDILDHHFLFETPSMLPRVCETLTDDIIWEAPARNLVLRDHKEILAEYQRIYGGMLEPIRVEVLRRFGSDNEAFDDRIIEFTANQNNVWKVQAGKRVRLRLLHYIKTREGKLCHEIGYEIWNVLDE
ncbi:MAG: hypothetical protein FJZ58_01975 [Chlamydiae bacterium]|nr:hypothetical protein [Chlamydiota bacterium]